MRSVILCASAILLVALGCGAPAPHEPTTTSTPPPAPPPRTEAAQRGDPHPEQPPMEAPVLITYTRSGGIAGAHETLTVYEDGHLHFHSRGRDPLTHRIDQARIRHVESLIEAPEFFELEGPYGARGQDLITYTIAAQTSRGSRTVVAMDAADQPEHLQRIIRELDALREAAVMQTNPRPPRN